MSSWLVAPISNGQRGIDETLRAMAGLVRASQIDPRPRAVALELATRAPSFNFGLLLLRQWVRQHMRLINEPVEMLTAPVELLRQIETAGFAWGDCDDAAILTAAIGTAMGLPAAFEAAVSPDGAGHVWAIFQSPNGDWQRCDPTSRRTPPADWNFISVDI